MKTKFIVLISILIILICAIITKNIVSKRLLLYMQEYNVNNGNIKGNVDVNYYLNISNDLEIGANFYGYPVFKNPDLAHDFLLNNYSDIINELKNKCELGDFSSNNVKQYEICLNEGAVTERLRFVSEFFDIYENSYYKS